MGVLWGVHDVFLRGFVYCFFILLMANNYHMNGGFIMLSFPKRVVFLETIIILQAIKCHIQDWDYSLCIPNLYKFLKHYCIYIQKVQIQPTMSYFHLQYYAYKAHLRNNQIELYIYHHLLSLEVASLMILWAKKNILQQ